MTAGPTDHQDRPRRSLDAVAATTPVRPDWDDVVRRAEGRPDLSLAATGPRRDRRLLVLAAAAVLAVVALAAAVATDQDGDGNGRDDVAVEVGAPAPVPVGPRFVPDPLPDGWSVVDVASEQVQLTRHLKVEPLSCPCVVAQWHDGQGRTATYRASQDLLETREPWQEVVDLGGRANHTLGVCPFCDYVGDVGETLLWSTASGRGELTVTGLDRSQPTTWFADGPGRALAAAVAGADGGVVNRIEGWTPLTDPVELASGEVRSTTVTLESASGSRLAYEVTPAGPLRSLQTTARPDETSTPLRPTLLAPNVLERTEPGVLLGPWVDADVLIRPPGNEPIAPLDEQRQLLASLRPATATDWADFLAAAGLEDPEADDSSPAEQDTSPAIPGRTPPVEVVEVEQATPARVLPDPLPPGWQVVSATESTADLGGTCPCRLAQWRIPDTTVLLTYRERSDPLPDDALEGTEPVDLGPGRTAYLDHGPDAGDGEPSSDTERLRWATGAGHAELTLTQGAGGTAPGRSLDLGLARAIADSRGTQVPEGSTYVPLAPPLDLATEQTSSTLIQLRTASGTLATVRTTSSGGARWSLDRLGAITTVSPPLVIESADPTLLGESPVPPGTAGTDARAGSRRIIVWDGADVTVGPVASVEPGRREDTLPATDVELDLLPDHLRAATEQEWTAFLAEHG